MIAVDSPLATLETEKATMDVPATQAGRVVAVLIKKGDKVSAGTPVVEIEAVTAEVEPTLIQPGLPASAVPPPPVAPPPAPSATRSSSSNSPPRSPGTSYLSELTQLGAPKI